MTLVEYLSGLFVGPARGPREPLLGATGRERPTPAAVVVEPVTVDPAPPYVYECRRCGTTVDQDTTVCPRCDRYTIAEYPVS